MSNLSNPIRVYDPDLTLVGELDDYSSAFFTRSWYGVGQFTIQTNANTVHASDLQKGRIVMFAKDVYRCGLITSLEKKLDEDGKGSQVITASGFELPYIFSWRIVLPPAGQAYYTMTDSAEAVMKTLVDDQCGPGAADADRTFSALTLATDQDRGASYTLSARLNTTVAEELQKISLATELGYFVYLNETTKKYVFEVAEGVDRTAGQSTNPRAIFSDKYDTIKSAKYHDSDNQYRNYAYTAGQGIGEDREIVEVYSTTAEPTDLDRKEMYVDARDLPLTAELQARGSQKLEEVNIQFTVDGIPLTYSPLVYRTDYDLGDLVTVDVYDTPYTARITEVKESWEPLRYTIDVVFDKEPASLPMQVSRAVETVKNNLNSTEGRFLTLESTVATGTPPLVVASTTKVDNFNADKVDGYDFNQGLQTTDSPTFDQVTLTEPTLPPLVVTSTAKVANLNADLLDGFEGLALSSLSPGLDDGLEAHWSFDDMVNGATTLKDQSGNARNVTLSGGVTEAQGVNGKAIHTNGVNGYAANALVSIPTDPISNLSLTIWVINPDWTNSTISGLFNRGDTSGFLGLYKSESGVRAYIRGLTSGNLSAQIPNAQTPGGSGIYFIVGVFDVTNSRIKIYLNGILVADNPADYSTIVGGLESGAFRIGHSSVGSGASTGFYSATFDEARIYSRALSEAEVRYLYTNPAGQVKNVFTASQIVDGPGSGLNADLLDGLHAGQLAISSQAGNATISVRYTRYTGAGGHTFTLPAATGTGLVYTMKHAGTAGTLTISRAGADLIDGVTSFAIGGNSALTVVDAASGKWEVI